jgi:RNA polymerase primary sigma factor
LLGNEYEIRAREGENAHRERRLIRCVIDLEDRARKGRVLNVADVRCAVAHRKMSPRVVPVVIERLKDQGVDIAQDRHAKRAFPEAPATEEPLEPAGLLTRDLGRIPLRLRDEELSLARRYRAVVEASPAGKNRNRATEQSQGDGRAARHELLESNLYSVWSIARAYGGRGSLDPLDLFQIGAMGLMKALGRFDPERGVLFGYFAHSMIHQAIRRAIREQIRMIVVPTFVDAKLIALHRQTQRLTEGNGYRPTAYELVREFRWRVTTVGALRQLESDTVSIDETVAEGDQTLAETLVDRKAQKPGHDLERAELVAVLSRGLRALTPRERNVLKMRFGLHGGPRFSLQKVARLYGVCATSVMNIQAVALEKMASGPGSHLLPAFLFDRD